MNLPSKQKQTHRRRHQTCGCQAGGEEGAGRTGCEGPRRSVAERSYPLAPRSGAATESVRLQSAGAAERSYPTPEVRGGGREEQPRVQEAL